MSINEDPSLALTSDSEITNADKINAQANESAKYTIRIFSSQGTLLSTVTRAGKSFTIPLNNLRDGIYVIELNDGKNSYRQQLIVKHN
ncbi:MAG: T9SS type A sorting domain-containing protein [Bacteroidetes bacterium]|nr:MAG: T9SS type A sorting domain-containing protein [Bacteroidota bacterium]